MRSLRRVPPGAAQLAPPPTPLTTSRAWNAAERIALWPAAPPNGTFVPATLPADWPAPFVANVASPELRVFPAQQPNGHAVLVIPGGGYQFVSVENEGADFAARLNARGYTVFVLVYRLPSEGWQRGEDVPLQDAQRAMRVIRANAARWKIDARTLAVVGFSAGGHLAATLSTGFAEPVYVPVDGADAASARPFRRAPRRRGDATTAACACDRRHGGAGLEQSEPAHRHACRGPARGGPSLSGGRTRVRVWISEFPYIVMDRRLRGLARATPGQFVEPGVPGRW
jgi:acetyl esterase/lipase